MFDRHWAAASDEELLRACRHGDTERFSELWDRHRKAGLVAARNLAPGLDAEELVSEAYLKIFELVRDGRGPREAFRPYLYRVIKTVAADQLRSPERATADLEDIPDLHEAGPWEDNAFDLNAVATAFATLAPRWQAALWYTEVEQMPPREAAMLLGISPNSVSALAARAREGLKSAWVEAHVTRELAEADCKQTMDRLQRYQRGKLTARASREVDAHLDSCEACASAAAEFSSLNHRLGLTLAAALLGGVGASALFGELGLGVAGGGTAAAAAIPGGNLGGGASSSSASSGSASSGGASAAGVGATVGVVGGIAAAAIAVIGGAALVVSTLVAPGESAEAKPSPIEQTEQTVEIESDAPFTGDRAEDERSDEPVGPPAPGLERDTAAGWSEAPPASSLPIPVPRPGAVLPSPGEPEPAEPGAPDPDTEPDAPGLGTDNPGTDEPGTDEAGDSETGTGDTGTGDTGTDPDAGTPGTEPDDSDDTGESGDPGTEDPGSGTEDPGSGTDDPADPSLDLGFTCFASGLGYTGTASEYGVIRARVTPPGGEPIEVFHPNFDPARSGETDNAFDAGGIFTDPYGNTFDFGFFAGTDPAPSLWWWGIPLTPLTQWGSEFDGVAFSESRVEFRLVTPDGRQSEWTTIKEPGASLIAC